MKKLLAIAIVLVVAPVLYAQPSDPPPSAASLKYSEFRKQSTDPLYSVSKIKALIKKIKRNQDDNMILPDKTYNSLTFKEKLSFALLHGEDFSQNCSDVPQLTDEHKKLFAYYPGPFGDEAVWSDRQRAFLDNNRTKVIAMLRDTIKARKRIGVNLKQAIVYLKATSLIPDAIAVYNRD